MIKALQRQTFAENAEYCTYIFTQLKCTVIIRKIIVFVVNYFAN